MKVFFAGHNNFGNRGCEALVRSISGIIKSQYPNAIFYTPSVDIPRDSRQWPDHEAAGIRFVPAAPFPKRLRYWHWSRRLMPMVEKLGRPSHHLPEALSAVMADCDLVIMTGGDTISLDYDLPSLYDHAGYIDHAKRLGKKTMLWAASVGPFSRKPHVEALMKSHLADYDIITVRETATFNYLKGLGVANVYQVTDPAFTLKVEEIAVENILPQAPAGILGLNVSPLIRKFRGNEESMEELDREVLSFIQRLLAETEYGVVLLPHVGPLDGGPRNNDHHYMKGLLDKHQFSHPRLKLAPADLNASQLKFLISHFRFFIGARTHATIAAFSMGVPTISIAYSVKAKGINSDLFGDADVVLETPDVSAATLWRSLKNLEANEAPLKNLLAERIPVWRDKAHEPLRRLASL